MTSKEKNRLASIFLLVHGGFQTLLMIGLYLFFFIISLSAPASEVGVFLFIGLFYLFIFLIFMAPQLIGGWKMYKEEPNAKLWGTIASFMACLSFPFGIALGIYNLIFLLGDEGKRFYGNIESKTNPFQTNFQPNKLPNAQVNNVSDFDKTKERKPYSWMDR